MEKGRQELYQTLFAEVANTPLVSYEGYVPNDNKIVIKRECDLPYGSHYDRVFLHLYHHYEHEGLIEPGCKVLETTSGSAGVSFAGLGKALGYECFVAIPAGGEKAREKAILEYLPDQEHLLFTPEEKYLTGFPGFVKRYLVKNRDVLYLNHSRGNPVKGSRELSNNDVTLKALGRIAEEVSEEVDYFLPAVGNGSSVLGVGRLLKPRTQVVAYETFQSAVTYELKHPGQYKIKYGLDPGTLSRHKLPGTSYNGIEFPHITNAVDGGFVDEVVLVSDRTTDQEFLSLTRSYNELSSPEFLPHWDVDIIHAGDLGRTTKAGLAVALQLAEKVRDKNILVIGYDKAERYDPIALS